MYVSEERRFQKILGGVTDRWDTCFGIARRCYPGTNAGPELAEKMIFPALLDLCDQGAVEWRRRVVYGARGGELVFLFRRVGDLAAR